LIQQFFGILRNKAPNAVVYMSAISDIIPNGTCHLSGTFEVAQDTRMTNLAIANGYALAGPFMGPLYNETGYPNMVDNSKCHPNAYGEQVLGAQLVQFFDALTAMGVAPVDGAFPLESRRRFPRARTWPFFQGMSGMNESLFF
jgi:hypothetical protein